MHSKQANRKVGYNKYKGFHIYKQVFHINFNFIKPNFVYVYMLVGADACITTLFGGREGDPWQDDVGIVPYKQDRVSLCRGNSRVAR